MFLIIQTNPSSLTVHYSPVYLVILKLEVPCQQAWVEARVEACRRYNIFPSQEPEPEPGPAEQHQEQSLFMKEI